MERIEIDDLDADALLERTDQDEGLARMILLSFAESQRDSAAQLPELLATDPPAAARRVHDLKGTLGNIGATRLYQDAIRLSERLHPHLGGADGQNQHDHGTCQLAEALQAGVARLCADIEAALTQPSRRHPQPVPAGGGERAPYRVGALSEAGRARDAQRMVAELDGIALETTDRVLLDRVAPLVRRYRLRDALALRTRSWPCGRQARYRHATETPGKTQHRRGAEGAVPLPRPRPLPQNQPRDMSMPRLSKPTTATALTAALLSALCSLPAMAAQTPVPGELRFDCSEQAGLRVVVGADGQLTSEATPASLPDPVTVHVINLEHRTSGPAIPARIDSSDDSLNASTATWQPGNSVSADDGRLRLDLTDRDLYLVTPELGNQAHFRRFSCAAAAQDPNQLYFQCEPGFQLRIGLVNGDDGQSANIHYTGGALDLPQVRSASGARYERDGNELWIKGDEAMFRLAGSEQHRCSVAD